MDISMLAILVLGLAVGVAVGAVAAWLVAGSRHETGVQRDAAGAERQRTQLAEAEARAAQARSEVEQARSEVAEQQTLAARAGERAAEAAALAAELRAELSGARVERDNALARAAEIAEDREAMIKDFKVLSAETLERQGKSADASADQRLKATERLMAPVAETLKAFQERLNAVEVERASLAAELKSQVQTVRATGEELRRETRSLVTALRKPQVRGSWGELQLKRVAEISGMVEHCDFTLQHTSVTSGDQTIRPDMRVDLGEGKFVYVDSKVPLESFLNAQETEDEAQQAAALAQFAKNVRTHVDQLSGKAYWTAGPQTPEFVVLFLPSEALAAEALAQLPDLHEYGAAKNVILASPGTLIAMLRAVAYGWKQAALAESAAEVFELGRELYSRLGSMGGHFDKLGRALTTAVKSYNQTLGSLESRVLVTARRMAELQVDNAELVAPGTTEEPVRQITAGELVDDAASVAPMIGRTARRRDSEALPEADQLRRDEPDLFQLTDGETPSEKRRRRSS
ncbi:DNA recombination protein RmuC [Propionibacteriaceae bacterium Y1700]|uniref:DNA recombination protein RmuC n=1 Tax=Microlunatus sp. Y1700 TaxID=3418487 RepID=UPI003DA7540C